MPQPGELNPCDMRQDLLQGVKGHFQVRRTCAPTEQKHLGVEIPETLHFSTHLDDHLKVILEGRRELPHRQVLAASFFSLAPHGHADKQLKQPTRESIEYRRPHLRCFHPGNESWGQLALGYLLLKARQRSSRYTVDEQRRVEDR